MESISKDLTENTDNDASEVVSHCLATSVILRKILQHFPNTELLTCSLVNKQWNYEARSLIRDRGSSIANLVDSYLLPPRRDLAAFASDLLQMNVVPFCGMKISLDWIPPSPYLVHPFQLSSSTEASIIPDVIFERLPFKYFHIVIEAPFGGCSDPTLLFVQKVLQGLGGDLEELAVSLRPEHDNFFQRLFRQYTFPNLKTFSFDARDDEDYTKFIKMLLSNAPNLQELRVDLSYLKKNVLEGSSAMLVPSKDFDPFLQQFSESFVSMLKLRSLSAAEGTPDFSVERFNRIMPLWLETSRTSLKSLKIHSVFALPIMGYGICLENVTELILYMDSSRALDFLRVCDLLKVFDLLVTCDFTRIFPKLQDVSIECRPNGLEVDHLKQFLSQGKNAMLENPMRDRAANIKHLSLSQCLNSYTARLLPNVFPDIQRLSVRLDEQLDISCGFIWKHWVGLQEIKVQKTSWIRDVPRIANLDSVFCGIFPEEVDELRGKDDEYLKCVNIVPIMPSITCLKNLKKFRFVFDWSDWSGTMTNGSTFARGDFRDPTFVFSKVSGLVAFARCPALSVSLETNWAPIEKALRHMKAYASVVLTR